jgi:integrase/recombinase XerD
MLLSSLEHLFMKVAGHGQAKILTPQEVAQLFQDGLTHERDRALFGICLYTGCRINEACSLLTADVYGIDGKVRPKITLRKRNTKGKQGTRSIPTHPELAHLLETYRPGAGAVHLFPGRHGRGHLHPDSASAILRQAAIAVGMEGASTHSFRRTALTRLSNAGVPLRVIQEISGHKSLGELQRYLAVTEQQVEEAIGCL